MSTCLTHKLTSEAAGDLQATYQYWGALLFAYMDASSAQTYVFQMQVDTAARLWIDSALIIDATCMALAQDSQHLCCILRILSTVVSYPAYGTQYTFLRSIAFPSIRSSLFGPALSCCSLPV